MRLIWIVALMVFLLAGKVFSEEKKKDDDFVKGRKTTFRVEDSVIKNPLKLRDPFKKKRVKGKKKRSLQRTILVDNSYSNIPRIGDTPIKSIKIVGILLGKERVAMAQVGGGGQVYFLREGMEIGEKQSKIRAILPGGIVIVEKMRNVYDEDEYIETVIPFSGGL